MHCLNLSRSRNPLFPLEISQKEKDLHLSRQCSTPSTFQSKQQSAFLVLQERAAASLKQFVSPSTNTTRRETNPKPFLTDDVRGDKTPFNPERHHGNIQMFQNNGIQLNVNFVQSKIPRMSEKVQSVQSALKTRFSFPLFVFLLHKMRLDTHGFKRVGDSSTSWRTNKCDTGFRQRRSDAAHVYLHA